jgi:hypothetical protein
MPDRTQTNAPKRVWILGAGFSRSLGGPLMFDLLSLASRRRILRAYPQHISEQDADLIFWLFHCGAGFPEGPLHPDWDNFGGKVGGERRWQDAEEFLDIVDSARTERAKAGLLEEVFGALHAHPLAHALKSRLPSVFGVDELPDREHLLKTAKRMVAASCCTFLDGVDRDVAREKERWRPYQQWLGHLRANDTIITFNYDLVVETLNPTIENAGWAVHVQGVGTPDDDASASQARKADLASLYKLHGSVNWNQRNGSVHPLKWAPELLSAEFDLAIATPGDSKMRMADGLFRRLWMEAATKLAEADEVYIIGFRFPASDAFPRDKLLDGLGDNQKDSLSVNIVLGPDDSSDLRRVRTLLEWTTGTTSGINFRGGNQGRVVTAHTLWAEEYLKLWASRESRRR